MEKRCNYCNKLFTIEKSRGKNPKYCNVSCYSAQLRENAHLIAYWDDTNNKIRHVSRKHLSTIIDRKQKAQENKHMAELAKNIIIACLITFILGALFYLNAY